MFPTRRLFLGATFASIFALPPRRAVADDGYRLLTARKATCQIASEPAAETTVFGFDGQVPGPLLRCKKGDNLKIRLVNQLDQPLTLSCWGVRLANAMDGVSGLTQSPVLPGQSFDYHLTPPDAGFYWYRSLVPPSSGAPLRHGLYGALIVEEPDAPFADHELVAILADWQLDQNAQIAADALPPTPAVTATAAPDKKTTDKGPSSVTTVNSQPIPLTHTWAPGARVRLRLLNASALHMMFIGFDNLKPLVLAIDGQPCEAFAPFQNLLPLGPGARYDLMFDLPAAAGTEARLLLRSDEGPDRPLFAFKTAGDKRPDLPVIVSLALNNLLPIEINLRAALKKDLIIDGGPKPVAPSPAPTPPVQTTPLAKGTPATPAKEAPSTQAKATDAPAKAVAPSVAFSFAGTPALTFASEPIFSVKRGTPVSLGLVNKTEFNQQIHVHGHVMRLLHDLDDGWEPYWRDSVIVPRMRTKHIAFVADNPGKWAIECRPLDVPGDTMLAWFEVK